jgi:periplasmic protein TonB
MLNRLTSRAVHSELLLTRKLSALLAWPIFLLIIFAVPSSAQSQAVTEWIQKIAAHFRTHAFVHPDSTVHSGEVRVAFTLDRSGKITSANLEKSTGFSDLDAAAVKAVENAQPFPAPPAEVDDSHLKFSIPFIFREMGDDEWSRKILTHLRSRAKLFRVDGAGRTGKAIVRFTLDRSGNITSANLDQSTGFSDLDATAVKAVENAQPFPTPPAEVEENMYMGQFFAKFVFGKIRGMEYPKDEGEEKLKARLRGICRGC